MDSHVDASKSDSKDNKAQSNKLDRRRFLGFAGGVAGLSAAGLWAGLSGCTKSGGGGDGEVVRIISSLPRTGSAKGQTNTIVNGIQMAIDEYGGSVAGMKIDYLDWDDATAAAGAWDGPTEKANAQKAAADPDVMAYIGPYNSNAAMVSMPELNEAGLLQISPAVTWPGLTKKIDGVAADEPEKYRPTKKITFCRVCTTDDVQGPLSADFAKSELKVKRVYILDDKELYGAGVAKLFRKRCEQIGIEVIAQEGITVSSIEFGGLMTKIKGTNPDLVYFGGTTQSKGGQLAKDLVAKGPNCPMMAPDGCYEQAFIDSAGPDVLNGRCYVSIVGSDWSQLKGSGAEFVKRYQEKFKTDPEAFAVYGYEAGKVVLEAIKQVGKKDREAIIKAVLSTKEFDKGGLGKWSFDANGDTTLRQLTISRVEGGKFKPIKTVTVDA